MSIEWSRRSNGRRNDPFASRPTNLRRKRLSDAMVINGETCTVSGTSSCLNDLAGDFIDGSCGVRIPDLILPARPGHASKSSQTLISKTEAVDRIPSNKTDAPDKKTDWSQHKNAWLKQTAHRLQIQDDGVCRPTAIFAVLFFCGSNKRRKRRLLIEKRKKDLP